jgi:hypothetical protein
MIEVVYSFTKPLQATTDAVRFSLIILPLAAV